MLSPEEFSVGNAKDARGLTLLLPRGPYERPLLIVESEDKKIAVILDQEFPFSMFDLDSAESWTGVLIPDVRVEVDERSVVDTDGFFIPSGLIVRERDYLALKTDTGASRGRPQHCKLVLTSGLPMCSEPHSAGFSKWRIVLGEGLHKRTLREFTVEVPDRGT